MTAVVLTLSGAVSWLFRVAFITVVPVHKLPPGVRRVLEASTPAVLAAMVATSLAPHVSQGNDLLLPVPLLAATVLTALVAWRTQRLGLTVVVGIGSLWLLQSAF